jgi:hypothetical protein
MVGGLKKKIRVLYQLGLAGRLALFLYSLFPNPSSLLSRQQPTAPLN